MTAATPEYQRLEDDRNGKKAWKKWGPYLSERQCGTVREDYSRDGDARMPRAIISSRAAFSAWTISEFLTAASRWPGGGHLNQADGTAWMAMYCLNMMRIALELALSFNRVYEDIASKFFEHFLYVAQAMEQRVVDTGLWSEKDGFYYDVLSAPDGSRIPLKIRSMVGLIPLFAVEVMSSKYARDLPGFADRLFWFLDYRPDLASLVSRWTEPGQHQTMLLSLLRGERIHRLEQMLEETEFLSDYGVRSLSRQHAENYRVSYEPGESESELFGGNSNWRGLGASHQTGWTGLIANFLQPLK
jgi:hypothetical protein